MSSRSARAGLRPDGPLTLLNPGPVNVSERVRRALLLPDLCHREEEAARLLASVRSKLRRAFGGEEYEAAVLTGSGTAAVEAAVSSAVSPGKRLLVVDNGVYGARIAAMAAAHGIEVFEVRTGWLRRPAPEAVEQALRRDPDIEVVAMVQHETTVGLLNPVAEIGDVVRRQGRTLLVDAVSGLAGDALDLATCGVGLAAGTAGKCVQGFPGVGFVLVRRRELRRLRRLPPRSVYLHLPRYCGDDDTPPVPFTPAMQILAALDEALSELLEETVAGRIARYRAAALHLRRHFAALGLEMLVPEPWRSNCLTSMRLPVGVSYASLHAGLKKRGFVIYEGQGRLRGKIFRVANMGALTTADFDRFRGALSAVLGRRAS